MGYYDELDDEIDQEMGWRRGKGRKGKGGKSPRRSPDYWLALLRTARATTSPLWRLLGKIGRVVAKVAFFPIISPLGYSKHFNVHGDMVVVKRSIAWRICDAVLTRALLTPVILGLFLVGMVYASTHPRVVQAVATPGSFGVYFQRVNLISLDNQRLSAWLIPPMSAEQMAYDPTGTLLQKWPAAVVVHGLGASHDQYLPLAQSLHNAGFAVLMLDMRGQGESDPAAVTYGLRERMDVLAGVKFLRETIYVDQTNVCVVGHDMGATAALQAASLDSSITAVVADGMWPKFEDRAREIFSHPPGSGTGGTRLPTQWLAPLYSMAFEIGVRDRLSQLDPEAVLRGIHTQRVLFIARTGPEYAPVQDILTLATNTGSEHEVFIDNPAVDGDTEERTVEFLTNATGWKGPKLQMPEELQEMLKHQIQK